MGRFDRAPRLGNSSIRDDSGQRSIRRVADFERFAVRGGLPRAVHVSLLTQQRGVFQCKSFLNSAHDGACFADAMAAARMDGGGAIS
jgi:hypothetical protein